MQDGALQRKVGARGVMSMNIKMDAFRTRSRPVLALLGLAIALAMASEGCRRNGAARDAIASEVNGYFCPKCRARFYVDSGVFAAKCAGCGNLEIDEVWAHWCEPCQALTLAPRSMGESVACSKCGKETSGIKMPSEQDMVDWGAKKATREAVSM